MNGQTVFAVPKDRMEVTVRLGNGVSLDGDIYLECVSEPYSLHEKVVMFLENNTSFFPIKVKGSGTTEFINKDTVRMVEISLLLSQGEEYFPPGDMHSFPVSVYLNFSSTLYGEIIAEVPIEKARLSDSLNLPARFLTLKTESKMCYLNKNTICKVIQEQE